MSWKHRQWAVCSALLAGSLLAAASGGRPLLAQNIMIHAVDGKSGKPMANQRLLLILYENFEDRKKIPIDSVSTDANGTAVVSISRGHYLQVWVDEKTLCASNPNSVALSVEEIHAHGGMLENICNKSIRLQTKPDEVVVYAREATLREKMAW